MFTGVRYQFLLNYSSSLLKCFFCIQLLSIFIFPENYHFNHHLSYKSLREHLTAFTFSCWFSIDPNLDKYGETPLHVAHTPETVDMLLENNLQLIDVQDMSGQLNTFFIIHKSRLIFRRKIVLVYFFTNSILNLYPS